MISLRVRQPLLNQHILKKSLLGLYSTSIEPAKKPTEEYYEKELKQFETLTNITKKVRPKKPQREPFVKNLLLGNFDTEILTFPQLEISEVNNVDVATKALGKLLKQRHMVNVDTISNVNFRQNLADHQAIGLQASQFLDGRESTPMEVMRFLETLADHPLGENILHNEMLGVQTLVRFANDKLKKKYLHPVMKGEKLTAFCMTEHKLSDVNKIKTKAVLTEDKKHWIINGKKTFVVNGVSADYLIVFATVDGDAFLKEVKLNALLVEKDTPGISWKKLEPADMEIAEIDFENVQVPAENIIGELNNGEKILAEIISDFRLSSGPSLINLTRKMLNNLHQSIVEDSTDELELYATDAARSRFGEIAMNLYAAESVTYLTAGLQDWYEKQDVTVESAIVKVLSTELAHRTSTYCIDLVGLPATLKDHWARKAHDDVLTHMTLHEPNDSMKLFIALMGLQHAGINLQEKIKKLRNPLYHGTFILKRIFTEKRNNEDDPKLDMDLFSYLHPTLQTASKQLEYCVKRLMFATERILTHYGLECVNKHVELRRLADVMIDCYAMTAVLARASRSYCVGLQFSDYEIILATAFCNAAKERVKKAVLEVYVHEYKINEKNYTVFAKQLTKSKNYFIESPIRRFI